MWNLKGESVGQKYLLGTLSIFLLFNNCGRLTTQNGFRNEVPLELLSVDLSSNTTFPNIINSTSSSESSTTATRPEELSSNTLGIVSIKATSSKAELVFDWEVHHDRSSLAYDIGGKANTFDGPPRFYKNSQGEVFMIASSPVNYRVPMTEDFKVKRSLVPSDQVFHSAVTLPAGGNSYYHVAPHNGKLSGSCEEANYDNRLWIFGLWSSDGLNFSSLSHHEYYPGVCPTGTTHQWVTGVHHLTSSDGGASFLPQAYVPYEISGTSNASRLVVIPQPSTSSLPGRYLYGYLHPSNIVKQGDYFYALVGGFELTGEQNSGDGLLNAGLAMIRTKDSFKTSGWQIYTDSGWTNMGHTFVGPGGIKPKLFLQQTSYNPYKTYPGGGQILSFSLVQHKETKQWIALGYSYTGGYSIQYSLSDSLESPNWGRITAVESTPVIAASAYPMIVDHSSPGYVFQYIGNTPSLYFVSTNGSLGDYAPGGQTPTDAHSRSVWRLQLQINLADKDQTPISQGTFSSQGQAYYSNGQDHCRFQSMQSLYSFTKQHLEELPSYASIPSVMGGGQICVNQPGDLTTNIPEGVFLIGYSIYYSNGVAYCAFKNMEAYTTATGRTDVNGTPAYHVLPDSMTDGGQCN